jgi:hypothetical protein
LDRLKPMWRYTTNKTVRTMIINNISTYYA